MIEQWFVTGQKGARISYKQWKRTRLHTKTVGEPRRMLTFTLTRPVTLEEAKQVARQISHSEIGDIVDRVGFQGRKFYVVLKPEHGVDGQLLTAIIIGILGLLGIGVTGWAVGLWAPGPLGLPNIVWVLIAGTALLISLGWVIGKLMPKS